MRTEATTTEKQAAGGSVLVLSYWNLNAPSFGGARRIRALLDCLGAAGSAGPGEKVQETIHFHSPLRCDLRHTLTIFGKCILAHACGGLQAQQGRGQRLRARAFEFDHGLV